MRGWVVAGALAGLLAAAAGCETPAGKFLAQRAADFGDCFRLQAGVGAGFGASVRCAGNLDLGFDIGWFPREYGLGWDYGEGYAFGHGRTGMAGDTEVNLVFAAMLLAQDQNVPLPPLHWQSTRTPYTSLNPRVATHACAGFFPAAISFINPVDVEREPGGPYLQWSGRALRANPWEHIHVFDVEATAMIGFARISVGFSPGEFVDFVLGFFGVDFARDDGRFEPGASIPKPHERRRLRQ